MSFTNIRQRLHKKRHRKHDDTHSLVHDDQFYDIDDGEKFNDQEKFNDGDGTSVAESVTSRFSSDIEKRTYEDQLTILQEQLVSAMIENQNLAQELKQCKENEANEKVKDELDREKKRNRLLQDQINNSDRGSRRRDVTKRVEVRPPISPGAQDEMLPPETPPVVPTRSGFDRLWERTIEFLYDVMEDFNDITQPEHTIKVPEERLSVKTLKENIRRFKVAVKPVTDTVKGIKNLLAWKSRSYTLIVFLIYMYSAWKGLIVPLILLLLAIRIVVNYLHFKGFNFHFAFLDPGEPEKESDDTLGLSDKFNLVLMVATKVQNGLGAAADSLEKVKNLLTWKHEGTRRVLSMLCLGFVAFALLPQSFLWKFIGLGFGVKIFIVNCIYHKYPKIKKRYDSNHRMWRTLPTDAEYDQHCAKTEMNRGKRKASVV